MNNSEYRWVLFTEDFKSYTVRDCYFLPPKKVGPAYISTFKYGSNFKDFIDSGNRFADWRGPAFSEYLWFDFDCNPKNLRPLHLALQDFLQLLVVEYGLYLNTIRICYTGRKGFEVGIPTRLFSFAPMISPEPYFKRLAQILVEGLEIEKYHDINAFSPHRFVRLINSQHETTKSFKIPLSSAEIDNLSIKEIKALAKNPRPNYDWLIKPSELPINDDLHAYWLNIVDTTKVVTESQIEALIRQGADNGDRHNTAFRIARAYRDGGRSLSKCHVDLIMWNRLNDPPISETIWFKTMLKSVYRHKQNITNTDTSNTALQTFLRTVNQFITLNDSEFRAFIGAIALTNTRTKQWDNIKIYPGSFICSIQSLADRTGGGVRKSHVRTLLDKLKKRGIVDTLKMPGNQGQLIVWRGKMANLFRENGDIHDA
jgi:hypothetical protein